MASARATAPMRAATMSRRGRHLTPLALRGNAEAQAFLGFIYENGFGAPQAYDAAADLYTQAAIAAIRSARPCSA